MESIECGEPVVSGLQDKERKDDHPMQQPSPGITLGADGILRWVYEMNMWKNPTLLITIWKVLLISSLAPALLMFFLSLEDGFVSALLVFVSVLGIAAGIVTVLMLLAYPLVGWVNGGKYSVIFEMDESCVRHIQMEKQFRNSQVLSMVAVLAGVMSGKVQAAGAGILAGAKQSTISRFDRVKKIVMDEKRHVIYVNENLSHNQVYADAADFKFVCDHILSRCKNAKMIIK